MKRRTFFILIALFVFTVWAANQFLPAYPTPEEAGIQYAQRVNGKFFNIENYATLEIRPFGGDKDVFSKYTLKKEDSPEIPASGFVWVKRGPFGWYVKSGNGVGDYPPPGPILYGTFCTDEYRFLYGQALSKDVLGVEIVLDNGLSYLDNIKNSNFGIITDRFSKAVEIQVIDQHANVIKRYTTAYSLATTDKPICQ
jgi:hypothetical protein